MGRIVEPPDIQQIFDGPGRAWTSQERIRVKEWLYEPMQLIFLLFFGLRNLGRGATVEDAEDAWGDFSADELDEVIDSYDPSKGRRFWNYLLLCFGRFCHRRGEEIREKLKRTVSLDVEMEGEEGERVKFEFPDTDATKPDEALEWEDLRRDLEDCINSLPGPYRQVMVMHYFEGMSVAEIAQGLDISEGNVKVRLHRARQILRDCLREKGWIP